MPTTAPASRRTTRLHRCVRRAVPARWRRSICSLVAAGLVSLAHPAPAAPEAALKATLLFHFTQFVEWPSTAFASPQEPFVIGVFGPDPFGPTLDAIVRPEQVGGHPIVVERCHSLVEARRCQLLFIARPEERNLRAILAELSGAPVLTVADFPDFVGRGGMIAFARDREDHVRLRIDPRAAHAAGLVISAKLLRVAETPSNP